MPMNDTQGVVSLGLFEGRLLKRPPVLFFVDQAMAVLLEQVPRSKLGYEIERRGRCGSLQARD